MLDARQHLVVAVSRIVAMDRVLGHLDHQTFMPPSTTTSMPVMYELSSEERNRATFGTSFRLPEASQERPVEHLACPAVPFVELCARRALSIRPGEIELTRMPCTLPSIASWRVIPRIPALFEFAEMRSASEIKDDVEPTKLTKREVNELRTLHRIVKQAGLQRHHRATRTVNERGCLFGGLDPDVTANDCGTLAREGQCSCTADAPAGSGHEADLPG
jgi:hypothetical protein